MAELRSFIFIDQMQPQTLCYMATWMRGRLPRTNMAAQIIEVAPGLDIESLTDVALKYADYGYILESGRIMLDGPAKALAENKDVKEFYLGMSTEGRKSFRDMKSYRRRKRWV